MQLLQAEREQESVTLPHEAALISCAWSEFGACTSFETLVPRVFRVLCEVSAAGLGYMLVRDLEEEVAHLWALRRLRDPDTEVVLGTDLLRALGRLPVLTDLAASPELSDEARFVIRLMDEDIGVPPQHQERGLWVHLVDEGRTLGLVRLGDREEAGGQRSTDLLFALARGAAAEMHRVARTGAPAVVRVCQVLAQVVDEITGSVRNHSMIIGECSGLIAEEMGLPQSECYETRLCGYLHDLGKLLALRELARTPGLMSSEERSRVRAAMVRGVELLQDLPAARSVAKILRHVGERWDGRGYPEGLSGEQIPVGSRIVAAAQRFYTAMEPRPYRGHLATVSDALHLLRACAGTELDPQVVECFTRHVAGKELGR